MVAPAQQPGVRHAPILQPPWFAPGEGVTLHRYLDDQFVPRFLQEAAAGRLTGARAQPWYGALGTGDPVLPLPLHQAFHIACCEVTCDVYPDLGNGRPAFAPDRIDEARFVIRRGRPGGEVQCWQLEQGEPLGWRPVEPGEFDPDRHRRLINARLIPPSAEEPPYSGEESYPMRSMLVRGSRPDGTSRSHTLLWGYLPLGGSYRAGSGAPGGQVPAEALAQELPWPFGSADQAPWSDSLSRPVRGGRAGEAFRQLLEFLLFRYRVHDPEETDNARLRALLQELRFYPPLADQSDPDAPPDAAAADSLLAWIEGSRDALLLWLARVAASGDLAGSKVPLQTGTQEDGAPLSGERGDDLYLTEGQAAALRSALVDRAQRAVAAVEEGLSLPRFGPGEDDLFFVLPFLRWTDHKGCKRVSWGREASIVFKVATPLDPRFQRPRTVILPSLDDIRKGRPRGVTFLAPKSVADGIRKIKPTLDFEEGGPGNRIGLCWSFSFSLPAITFCAMFLLMIILQLLNIFFFWMPYIFLALPRLCGKLLGEKK